MITEIVRPEASASLTFGTPFVVDPEAVVYVQGFEAGAGGWLASPDGGLAHISSGPGHNGSTMKYYVCGTPSSFAGQFKLKRTFTDLIPSRSYTVRAWVGMFQDALVSNAKVGVTGKGYGSPVTPLVISGGVVANWREVSYTFTATNETHEAVLEYTSTGTNEYDSRIYWDDVSLTRNALIQTSATLPITQGKVTMDDAWSPYIQATFDVALESEGLVEQLDPRESHRVTVTASEEVGATSKVFNLGLRSRTVDHAEGKITIELASDEALLIDKKRIASTVDKTPLTYQNSLRAICNWALAQIGASLEAGTADADLTAAWPRENLFTDPSLGVATMIGAGTGASAVALSSTVGSAPGTRGSTAVRWTAATGDSNAILDDSNEFVSVTPGRTYTVSAFLRSSVGRSANLVQRFYSAKGKLLKTVVGPAQNSNTAGWTRYAVTGRATKNSAYMRPYLATRLNSNGQFHYIDGILIEEDPEMLEFFDGGLTATSLYNYGWEDAVNDSVSTATPVVERPRELFYWKPGMSLWEFLEPLIQAAGLRLFCDESRKWRLVDPATYSVSGTISVDQQVNAVKGEDIIDRNREGLWADGVVIGYRWTDAYGNEVEKFDVAGTDGKVLTLNYDREYPGPGAASKVLFGLTGRGRTQDVTRLTDYSAAPGKAVTISLPGTVDQTGKLSQVIFDLSTGLMQLRTRGLTAL